MITFKPYKFIFLISILSAIVVGYIYRVNGDEFQNYSDPELLFSAAKELSSLFEAKSLENLLPLFVYSKGILLANSLFGVDNHLVGILINTVIIIKTVHLTPSFISFCPGFSLNLNRYYMLSATSGMYLLFAGIHLRDSFAILLTAYAFKYMFNYQQSTLIKYFSSNGLYLLFITIIFASLLFFTRIEYVLVPFILLYIMVSRSFDKFKHLAILPLALISLLHLITSRQESDLLPFFNNYIAYRELSFATSSDSSIGNYILYGLPFPLSFIFSSLSVLFVKFPFWLGMWNNAYNVFVSIAAIQMIFVVPIFVYLSMRIYGKSCVLFDVIIMLSLYLLVMISTTSIQSRHFAVMLPFIYFLISVKQFNSLARGRIFVKYTSLCLLVINILYFNFRI